MTPSHASAPEIRPRPARRSSDRRAHTRYTPAKRITCRIRLLPDGPVIIGIVHNLSMRGLAVIIGKGLDPGTVVSIWLVNDSATFCLETKFRVARCYALAGGDFFVGGQLDRTLSPGEIGPFLV
jgi:hypothetical protein